MRQQTIVPMTFGSVLGGEAAVRVLLTSTRDAFVAMLDRLDGRVEFGVQLLWDRQRAAATVLERDAELLRLRAQIDRNAGSSTYFARRQLTAGLRRLLEEHASSVVQAAHTRLRELSVASRRGTLAGDRMLFSASYLVAAAESERFARAAAELARAESPALTARVTGPWPPFSFVNLRLPAERGSCSVLQSANG